MQLGSLQFKHQTDREHYLEAFREAQDYQAECEPKPSTALSGAVTK
jgi:hypothetical protein